MIGMAHRFVAWLAYFAVGGNTETSKLGPGHDRSSLAAPVQVRHPTAVTGPSEFLSPVVCGQVALGRPQLARDSRLSAMPGAFVPDSFKIGRRSRRPFSCNSC